MLLEFQESAIVVMASLDDLFEDFSRLKEFSETQVVELVENFRQINEKLEEDLPSGLEGYAEFLKDKGLGGSGSKVEKLIKSSISSDCAQILNSDAYKLSRAYVISNYQSALKIKSQLHPGDDKEEETSLFELAPFKSENHEPLSFLRLVMVAMSKHSFTGHFGLFRPFRLPWVSSIKDSALSPAKSRYSLLFGRIQTLLKIEDNEGYELLFERLKVKEDVNRNLKNKAMISFLGDDDKLRILESLVRNEFSRRSNTALSIWITSKLSELISQSTQTTSAAVIHQVDAEFLPLNGEDTSKLLNDNENLLVEQLIPQAATEIKKLYPKDNSKAWQELEIAFNMFRYNLRELGKDYGKTISRLLGDEDDLLYSEIFEFLKINDLNTVAIPTIDELGKYKGGYSLVKKISQNNGLKAVRKKYVPWAMRKVAGDSSSIKDEEISSSRGQGTMDSNSRELLDEIFKLQSQLQAQQEDFERVTMELHRQRESLTFDAREKEKYFHSALQATEMQRETLTREQDLLRSQLSENEAKHQLEMQMMEEQIQKLKKEA